MLEDLEPGDCVKDTDYPELPCLDAFNCHPQRPRGAEWTYNIDLDRFSFIIDNSVYFNLEKIPRGSDHDEWVRYIQLDGNGDRCIDPLAPKEYFSSFDSCLSQQEQERALGQFASATRKIIDPKTWTKTSKSRSILNTLTLFTFANLVEDSYGVLSSLCYKYQPTKPLFIVPAQYLLTIAAPGLLHLTEKRAMDQGKSRPRGFRNRQEFYSTQQLWFRNCLVIMADNLDNEDVCKCWIGIAIEKLNATRQEGSTVTALLWSVNHAVAVVISDEGVSHSKTVPVVAAFKADDDAFVNGVDFLMHFLKPSFMEFTSTSVNVREPTLAKKPTYVNTRPRLPFDVVVRILDFVDVKTYNSCNILAKSYRVHWAKFPRIGQFKLFKAISNHGENISNYDMPLFRVTRCDDISSPTPVDMYLFHPNPAMVRHGYEKAKQPGTSFCTQIRIYDPVLTPPNDQRTEFMMVTLNGVYYATDYLVPAEDIGRRFLKTAFLRDFEDLQYESCYNRGIDVDIGFSRHKWVFGIN